ncbi:MAG: hypoxanthine phosphoribosyltransferase [Desulfuromonadales bacterium GWD2_61_12]|nr:MAG: hypoxanthine phosphoribosyltransferase [Desulfuromonadales bacterium GWC2_61_20]OGR35811.1 MAG: hypoxanthine phosphoribosyltransferase [Desulfuromonadales bacterium GWD2_61_12]HAD04568.1 hypoxanthine phosphoribosyltransferase [Desulfuromonas sp.]HBT83851.1 hypoxanthine phosphoribosyltransferase [Desulfuromonas sp.]
MPDRQLKPLFSRSHIDAQVKRLGAAISADYSGCDILVVAVLKGSFLFVADLVRAIDLPLSVDFVRLASYGSDTRSSGIVEMRMEMELPIRGRDVVVVEDIVDSGCTLETLYHQLLQRQPRSLKICTLVDKTARREVPIRPDYVGFTIDDGFIVGYGLDFDEHYRNLPDIYLLEEA